MIATISVQSKSLTADAQRQRGAVVEHLWLAGLVGISVLIALVMYVRVPAPAMIGWLCYLGGIATLLYRPRYGVYLIVGLSLIGDASLTPWYPFTKNFSSNESLLYVGDMFIFSPLESYIALTWISWLGQATMQRKLLWHSGVLLKPMLVFIGFITLGLVYGFTRGGVVNIALWETRAIYYLPAMLVIVTNLIETRIHVNRLIWAAIIGIFFNGVSGAWYVATVLNFNISSVSRIAEHPSSIQANTLFVLLIGAWIYQASYAKRLLLPVMLPVVLLSYVANQRRAAFIALALALIFIAFALYRENRRTFCLIAPVAAILGALYLGAFWNSSGALGQPARAIRSVIAPDSVSERDASSNYYRYLENTNIMFTIKTAPLTGVGFGNKFYIIAPMADISFFIWWEYITHNSIMWIWMQAGIGAFVSMLFLIGSTVITGSRAIQRMPDGDMSAIALTATAYIAMHFMFAYVDMSWGASSMVYIGAMMGIVNSLERISVKQQLLPPKRWPWLPDAMLVSRMQPE